MTEEDLAELARATQELRLKQETPDPPEALKSVPSLSLHDIPKEPIHVPTQVIITFTCLLFESTTCFFFGGEFIEHSYMNCRLEISME
jgi:Zn-dependent M16 (insulinase) family peptidase